MNAFVVIEALNVIINHASDNKDWDFYWKVRHVVEETYGCKVKVESEKYGLDNIFVGHRLMEGGTLK